MKKLLLTSDGLNDRPVIDFFERQFNNFENIRACIVATKRLPEDQIYIDAAQKEMEDFGIRTDVINISEDIDGSGLPEYDIYYSCGGNTFYILDRMRKTGIDKVLIRAIQNGKFYIGVSAGSILVGPDIEIAGWGQDADVNDIFLKDLSGFSIITHRIFPHYSERNKEEIIEFKRKINTGPVIALTDMQALFVTDNEALLIDEEGESLLEK